MKQYDVIIIGAGSAGLGNAGVANTIGLKTLLIEKTEMSFGGDCTNHGCVPSKAMIHVAQIIHHAHMSSRFGLTVSGEVDMKKVIAYIKSKQDIIRNEEDAAALRKKGYDVEVGTATFVNDETIKVNDKEYTARIILLCTGSHPTMVDIPGMDNVQMFTNENIFSEENDLPKDLVVIGGGPIGCELGQAMARLGSKVTIVNRGSRLLSKESEKVSQILERQFVAEGITVLNNATVKRFEEGKALIENSDGNLSTIQCNATLVAVGRSVNTKELGLEKAKIDLDKNGKIIVNDYLRTTNKKVYAIGDAAGSYMFSHGAEKMVRMLWRNLLIPIFKKKNTMEDLSWVTFTDPQVAHFGLTQDEMDKRNISYYRQDQSLTHDDRALIQEYTDGHQSIFMDTKGSHRDRRIIAGSLIAPNAGELVQELELAKHAEIPIGYLLDRVYPYPVQTRINQKTLRGFATASISQWKKSLARNFFRLFY